MLGSEHQPTGQAGVEKKRNFDQISSLKQDISALLGQMQNRYIYSYEVATSRQPGTEQFDIIISVGFCVTNKFTTFDSFRAHLINDIYQLASANGIPVRKESIYIYDSSS